MKRRRYGAKIKKDGSRKDRSLFLRVAKRYGKRISPVIILVVVIILVGKELHHFLYTSPIFDLSKIEVQTNGKLDESRVWRLIDEPHILKVDLLKLSKRLEQLPEVKTAWVFRSLPNSIIVEVEERLPIAQIRSNRYFPVDKDGVILPGVRNYPDHHLPLIVGVGFRVDQIKVGMPYVSKSLDKALNLLEAISSSQSLRDVKITRIDVRDPGDISFLTDEGFEVKVGAGEFASKIGLMDEVLADIRSQRAKVKYIDLRFGDVAIGWK